MVRSWSGYQTMCKWTPRIDVTWVELAVSKVVIGDSGVRVLH